MTAEFHDDDKVPQWTTLALIPRASNTTGHRRVAFKIVAALIVVALVVTGVALAFHRAADNLASVHRDSAASAERVATLTNELAHATNARDRSLRAASIAAVALGDARTAHLRSAQALNDELAQVDDARRQAYLSLVDANTRTAQLAALHTCLDGVSQALDMLGAGDVHGSEVHLQSIDGACQQAEAAA
jgi:hypothetical protein